MSQPLQPVDIDVDVDTKGSGPEDTRKEPRKHDVGSLSHYAREQDPAGDSSSTASHSAGDRDIEANVNATTEASLARVESDKPYTTFSMWEKRFIILTACLAATFSPFTGQVYFPALNTIAKDLNVSSSQINLTITAYMIFQGVAPSFIGAISDASGRRPSYMVCFSIYLLANIGLALQNNYAALLVLRCVQSSGSSGTVALVNAVIVDLVTSAERGSWVGYTSIASILGPAVGPVVGGALAGNLGWKSIFWFLVIACAVVFIPMLLFFPETGRNVVGDGSIPPPYWNRPLIHCITNPIKRRRRRRRGSNSTAGSSVALPDPPRPKRSINPLVTLKVLGDKETAVVLTYAAILFAGFYAVCTAIPSQFASIYNFDDVKLGLTFIPIGCGSICAAFTNGQLIDWNYRRHAKKLGIPVVKNRQTDLRTFPIEHARLEIGVPFLYCSAVAILIFGWVLHIKAHIAVPIVLLFIMGYTMISGFNSMNVLIVDIHRAKPATATAANNLTRCLVGALMTAVINPLIEGIGVGWAFTLVAGLYVVFSPMLWVVMKYGTKWRQERYERKERKTKEKEEKARLEEDGAGREADDKLNTPEVDKLNAPEVDNSGKSKEE